MEELIIFGSEADLGDEDLDLHRLHLVGEDLAQDLGVLIAEAPSVDVLTAVGEALEVGCSNSRDPELIELVVLTDAGEGDPVVDLADLAKRGGWVLGHDQNALVVLGGDERAAPCDPLTRVVGAILHDLFRGDVERHAHD